MERQVILSEEPKSSKLAIAILVAMFLAGFALWLVLYPVTSGSIVFWAGAVLMAVPGYVAVESLVSLGLGANFVKKLPRSARIIFGVFWVLICLLIISVVLGILSSMVGV